MLGNETPYPIWIKFCSLLDIHDIITYANFGGDQLEGFGVALVKLCPSRLTFIVVLTTLTRVRVCDM